MPRITKLQKQIADAHFIAKQANKYDDPLLGGSLDNLKKALLEGKTIRYVTEIIESKYVSIGSQILASSHFGYRSQSYKAGFYKGFKILLNNLKIK